jgi:PAS domain S-box-containing protein
MVFSFPAGGFPNTMPDSREMDPAPQPPPPARRYPQEFLQDRLHRLENEERHLWRLALMFLGLMGIALAAASWETLRSLPQRLEAAPVGIAVLVVLFAAYVAYKRHELSEIKRALMEAPPTEQQIEAIADVLARSQRRYRELIDNLDDLVFALSLDGHLRAANRRVAALLDLPFAALIDRPLDEFLSEPSLEAARKGMTEFLARRQWSGVVRVGLRHSGRVLYLDCTLHAALKEGEVIGISGLARDITAQRQREVRFTELFETLHEGTYFTRPDGNILDANLALARMLGYDRKEDVVGKNVNEMYCDPGDRRSLLRELDTHGSVRDREIVLRRRDGTKLICLDSSRAVHDESGRIARYQGTLVDITLRREMEERLHKEKEFGRRLVDSFPDLILVFDPDGRYTFVSPRIREVLGWPPESLLGRILGTPGNPEDPPELVGLFRGLLAGDVAYATGAYAMNHHDGTPRALRATAARMMDAEGRLLGVVVSVRDVTELQKLQAQLLQTEKLAAMGQMIAGFAHELNNPLTAILGATELLGERPLDDTTRRQVQMVHQQTRRAVEVVQNLLFFARPPAPGRARLDLNDLIQRSLQLHEYSLRMNGVVVDFLPDARLSPISGDTNQLMQVFLNLVINAEQAMRGSGRKGTLRIRVGQERDKVWAAFEDDGPGIAPDILPNIFDPFFTTKRPGGGTGLGLSSSLSIVREHGGTLQVQSRPGSGTIFTVTLPCQPSAVPVTATAGRVN